MKQPITGYHKDDENHWVAVGGYPGANYLTLGAPRTLRLSLSTDF